MKYKKGDRFIIEIDDVMENKNTSGEPKYVYRIKGFNTLVMDEYGLDRLTKIPENAEVVSLEKVSCPLDVTEDTPYYRGYQDGYRDGKKFSESKEVPKVTSEKKNVIVLKNDSFALDFLQALSHNGFHCEWWELNLDGDTYVMVEWGFKK